MQVQDNPAAVVAGSEGTPSSSVAETELSSAEAQKTALVASADTGGDESGKTQPSVEDPDTKPKETGFQRRTKRLLQEKAALEQRVRDLEAGSGSADTHKAPTTLPKFADFAGDIDAYTVAMNQYSKAEAAKEHQVRQVQSEHMSIKAAYDAKVLEFSDSTPDFSTVMQKLHAELDIPGDVVSAVIEDCRPDVAYALAKDIDEAERIFSLSPRKRALELAKIAERLDSKAPSEKKAKVSSAPAPVKPETGKAPAKKSSLELARDPGDAASQRAYREIRMQELKHIR